MNADVYQWRCVCGEDGNSISSLSCKRCGETRWSRLGKAFSDAADLLTRIYPSISNIAYRHGRYLKET